MTTVAEVKATIKAREMAEDIETMLNAVNSDPGHIARAKAKAERVKQEAASQAKAKAEEKVRKAEAKKQNAKEQASIDLNGIMTITFLLGSLWGYICHAIMF